MKKEIEKAIKETLVVHNKESIKYAVDRILRLFSVSSSLDLQELERKLDEQLDKETCETLKEWLRKQRQ